MRSSDPDASLDRAPHEAGQRSVVAGSSTCEQRTAFVTRRR